MKIVVATTNVGKLKEIASFLQGYPAELIAQSQLNIPSVEETGISFVENAILKAHHAAKHANMPALADDSGLVVDALGGEPGIHSARYAGPSADFGENIKKLLKEAAQIPDEQRVARFICTIAFVRHGSDPIPIIAQGQWEGMLVKHPSGKEGFGYDPVFFIPELNCTVAEISSAKKNEISHRAKALAEFVRQFKLAYPELKFTP